VVVVAHKRPLRSNRGVPANGAIEDEKNILDITGPVGVRVGGSKPDGWPVAAAAGVRGNTDVGGGGVAGTLLIPGIANIGAGACLDSSRTSSPRAAGGGARITSIDDVTILKARIAHPPFSLATTTATSVTDTTTVNLGPATLSPGKESLAGLSPLAINLFVIPNPTGRRLCSSSSRTTTLPLFNPTTV
jgi:hypothetical protein